MARLGKTECAVLRLLLDGGEMYGLELVKASRLLKRGSIYVTLDRLEDKKLISSRLARTPEGERGPPRRKYKITGAGIRVFEAWTNLESELNLALGGGSVS